MTLGRAGLHETWSGAESLCDPGILLYGPHFPSLWNEVVENDHLWGLSVFKILWFQASRILNTYTILSSFIHFWQSTFIYFLQFLWKCNIHTHKYNKHTFTSWWIFTKWTQLCNSTQTEKQDLATLGYSGITLPQGEFTLLTSSRNSFYLFSNSKNKQKNHTIYILLCLGSFVPHTVGFIHIVR